MGFYFYVGVGLDVGKVAEQVSGAHQSSARIGCGCNICGFISRFKPPLGDSTEVCKLLAFVPVGDRGCLAVIFQYAQKIVQAVDPGILCRNTQISGNTRHFRIGFFNGGKKVVQLRKAVIIIRADDNIFRIDPDFLHNVAADDQTHRIDPFFVQRQAG